MPFIGPDDGPLLRVVLLSLPPLCGFALPEPRGVGTTVVLSRLELGECIAVFKEGKGMRWLGGYKLADPAARGWFSGHHVSRLPDALPADTKSFGCVRERLTGHRTRPYL